MVLEQLFVGWFEQEDEAKGAELFQQAEIELRLEIDNQMPYIRYICRNHPSVGAEALRVDVERYALELAFNRKHPKFNSESFFKRLLKHYQDIEAYEKCQALINLKKSQE